MRPLSLFILLFLLLNISCEQEVTPFEATSAYYASIVKANDVAKLNFFFSRMPKGGDLHHHYPGAVYAETYLDWAKEQGYRINSETLLIAGPLASAPNLISIDSLRSNTTLYRKLMALWSDRDYHNHFHLQTPPDQHFFDTFGYFMPIINDRNANEGLKMLKHRAKKEQVQYIETMLNEVPLYVNDSSYDAKMWDLQANRDSVGLMGVFQEFLDEKISEEKLEEVINQYNERLNSIRAGIDDDQFTMRFQVYVLRHAPPTRIFSSLKAAFEACRANEYVVGVNIVSPENGGVAMRDYWLHMQMFGYLAAAYPDVNIAMHAGELAMGMVRPEDLTYHIRDALMIAGAERIGHGVDIPYETDAIATLNFMAEHKKVVEINLTSNEFILGVAGNRHPINLYREFNVPMVISTDDAGVSRNNLTAEYVLLASRYDFTYEEIKRLVFNSIDYSFLSDEEKRKEREKLERGFG